MVDLRKLKAGDKVKLRCGGEAVVAFTEESGDYTTITLTGSQCELGWHNNGGFDDDNGTDPFDIIAIEPKPFDWSEVKPGMCFEHNKDRVYFVGWTNVFKNAFQERLAAVEHEGSNGLIFTTHPSNLTRAPEHDIEVQS